MLKREDWEEVNLRWETESEEGGELIESEQRISGMAYSFSSQFSGSGFCLDSLHIYIYFFFSLYICIGIGLFSYSVSYLVSLSRGTNTRERAKRIAGVKVDAANPTRIKKEKKNVEKERETSIPLSPRANAINHIHMVTTLVP